MKTTDLVGTYNKNQKAYAALVKKMYRENPEITLPSEYASFFKDNLLRLLIRLARYKHVMRLLDSSEKVLEVGCGSGVGTTFLAQNCKHVTGIDVKKVEIEEAKKICRRKNVHFEQIDFFEVSQKRKWDAIIAMDVIEHLKPSILEKFLKKIKVHLTHRGLVILGTPTKASWPYQSPMSQASHEKCYDRRELHSILSGSFKRCLILGMTDEVLQTSNENMTWYHLAFCLP